MSKSAVGSLLAATLLVVGCGGTRAPSEMARLRIDRAPSGRVYTEGVAWQLSVRQRTVVGPLTVFAGRFLAQGGTSLQLRRGRYVVDSAMRACSGNCTRLDPPSDGCVAALTVAPGDTYKAVVRLRPSSGCAISTSKSS